MARISKAEILEAYQREVLSENYQENNSALQLGRKLRLISFESTSNGRDRKKRPRPREVTFIVDTTHKNRTTVYQVVDGEIYPPKNKRYIRTDQLAIETLTDLPFEQRSPDALLERLQKIRETKIK